VKNKILSLTAIKSLKDLRIRHSNALAEARGMRELIKVWWIAFRYHFVPASFLPAILGTVVAWALTGFMNQWFSC